MADNSNNDTMEWYAPYAGQILTYPFLPQLFKQLGYLDDNNQFKNDELHHRAVHLMHYIATGSIPNNESDLLMGKVLCGMSIDEPITSNMVLTDTEMATANEMLDAFIQNWEKLGNTSIDSVRDTFLTRNGMLEVTDATYQLTVETSGTDILLDYIPWKIDIINLPWLTKVFYVSWR